MRTMVLAAAALLLGMAGSDAQAQGMITWTDSVQSLGLDVEPGRVHKMNCPPAGALSASVWGDGTYTHDSAVCVAAVHAGLFTAQNGGVVVLEMQPGQGSYAAATRNGVSSRSYGSWTATFVFPEAPQLGPRFDDAREISWTDSVQSLGLRGRDGESFVMFCPAGGSTGATIWGDGLYTDDSPICVAAVHAGAITPAGGGAFTVVVRSGQSGYTSATRNGVSSSRYGSWGGSYEIVAG